MLIDELVYLCLLLFFFVSVLAMSSLIFYDIVDDSVVAINAGGPYGGTPGNNENEASGHPVGQNTYEDGYNVSQVCHIPSFGLQYKYIMLSVIHVSVKGVEVYGSFHMRKLFILIMLLSPSI